jgi:hypothetical protein
LIKGTIHRWTQIEILIRGTLGFIFMVLSHKNKNMAVKKTEDRTYVSLSFSCPPATELAINRRAAKLGMSRSEYLRRLFERDLYQAGLLNPLDTEGLDAPPRIKRNRKPKRK